MGDLARRRRQVGITSIATPNLPLHPPPLMKSSEPDNIWNGKRRRYSIHRGWAIISACGNGSLTIAFRESGELGLQLLPGLGACIHFWDAFVFKAHPLRD